MMPLPSTSRWRHVLFSTQAEEQLVQAGCKMFQST
jgi:hypothetical protein